jgi:hypothetical protein
MEGLNKILLHILKWLYVPDIGEQDDIEGWEKLLRH